MATAKTPIAQGATATLTARVIGLGGGGPLTGTVGFSSSIDGAISSGPTFPYSGESAVAAGRAHTCLVNFDGTVSCWGNNRYGQLGNSTSNGADTPNPTPTQISGLTGVVSLMAGDYHTCAITSSGGVKCWGRNQYGQLGNSANSGIDTANPTPLNVTGLSGAVALAAGDTHTCALLNNGTAQCWGRNYFGQLGNTTGLGANTAYPTPAAVSGLSGVVAIAASNQYSCALLSDGSAKCWGLNNFGQLGNSTNSGNFNPNPTPLDVTALSGAVALSAGSYHVCALTSAGTVKCWGWNYYGELGNSTNNGGTTPNPTPANVAGLTGIVALSAGDNHSCALVGSDGSVKCWGYNYYGQLGYSLNNNTTNPNPTPTQAGTLSNAVSIVAGALHSCAVDIVGAVKCWGINNSGQLAGGSNGNANPTPADVAGVTPAVFATVTATTSSLSAGSHTVTASFGGDVNYTSSNGAVTQDVGDAPTVTSISPTSGPTAGGTSVTVTGTNFTGATGVTFGGTAATGVSVDSATQITATSPAHAAGTVDVVVTTPIASSATGSADQFTYVSAPTFASISPTGGTVLGGNSVTLTGTNFTGATSVTLGGTAATSVVVVNATTITANAPAHAAGSVDVVVTTPGGTATGTGAYTYFDAPTFTSVTPSAGPTAGGTSVTIDGTNLTGASGVTFGGVAATAVTVVNATTITATTPAHAAGAVDIVVTTPGGTVNAIGAYTYFAAPTFTSVSPTSGPLGGGTSVTITGTNLTGASGVTFGGTAATAVTVVNATTVTATTPAHAVGSVNVAVTTPGGTATGTNAFSYTTAPTATLAATARTPTVRGATATFTARVAAYGANLPTGNVAFSSSINGALGSVALDIYGGSGSVAAGTHHSCALTSGGGVTCWGWNTYGQLGNSTNTGTNTANPTPTAVAGLSGVAAITAGYSHTCALLSGGTVKCWGLNQYGQLGNSTNSGVSTPNPTPADVAGLSGVVALAAGQYHTCALLSSGAVKCWGSNWYGQLGNATGSGTGTPNPTPLDVTGLSGVAALTAGDSHICALTDSGGVKCWGLNQYGQLGNSTNNGTNTPNPTPTDVAGLSGVTALAVRGFHSCALVSGGVKCWGYNLYGQLGNSNGMGVSDANPTPTDVAGLSGVAAIAAGEYHSCAVLSGGAAKCWGYNYYGQLGSTTNNGNTSANPTPLDVAGLSGAVALAGGGNVHSCALLSSGGVKCWGYNRYGALGSTTNSGNNNPNPSPLDASGVAAAFLAKAELATSALSVGSHTITMSYAGDSNYATSLGPVAQVVTQPPTATLAGTAKTPTQIGATATFTARVTAYGGGAMPTGTVAFHSTINGALGDVGLDAFGGGSAVATGSGFSCALTSSGGVTCWGLNNNGQLGNTTNNGNITPNPTPAEIAGLSGVAAIAAGNMHACALLGDGTVKCWGYNQYGELGNSTNSGTGNANPAPLDVTGLSGVVAIAAGDWHTCALLASGGVKCWGHNSYGQLGTATNAGTSIDNPTPIDVAGLGGVVALAAGNAHTCAVTDSGGVMCWGYNGYGQLGNSINNGNGNPNPTPAAVAGLSGVTALAAGYGHTCAQLGGGGVSCWGNNRYGQLGNATNSGTGNANPAPLDVTGLTNVAALTAGSYGTCALLYTGAAKCWGNNRYGSLGNATNSGTNNVNVTPLDVSTSNAASLGGGSASSHVCAVNNSTAGIKCWGWNYYGELANATNNFTGNANPAPATVAGVNAAYLARTTKSTSSLSLGSHTITTSYAGDSNYAPSSATVAHDVVSGPTVTGISPTVGPAAGGTTVTITGTNLTGATAVTFGGVAASAFTVDSATQITATSPAHAAGTVDVVVTTPIASTATGAADQFTYIAAPTFTSVSPVAGPIAGGTAVTITGTNLTGATGVTIGGAAATAVTVVNSTTVTAVTPAHAAGTVDVVVTTPGGTATGVNAFAYLPQPTFASVTPATGPLAGGTSVTITGTNLNGTTGVTFGGAAATAVTVVNSTTVTAVTPAHAAGAVNVVVATAGGTATGTNAFTYSAASSTLQVTPSTNMIALGVQSGPFNPASFSYVLKSSSGSLNWSIGALPDWLTASATSGTVDTTGTTVKFTVNTAATTKAVGAYGPTTVTFTNADGGGGNTTRTAGLTVSPLGCEALSRGPDFGGDGKTDILWRNDNGAVAMWVMNGQSPSGGYGLGTVTTDWRIVATADFNQDGKSDLLWRNTTTGQAVIWFISGVAATGSANLGVVPLDWGVVGAADFNGDGHADILWRNDAGTVAMWLLRNGAPMSSASIGTVEKAWRIAGLADFNGDGKTDLLWRSSAGTVALWLMDGPTSPAKAGLGNVPADWHIRGVGDFNGDGKADILWRNDDGAMVGWFMNGLTPLSSAAIGTLTTDWHVAGFSDFNADGKADLLWRHDNGNLAVWLMNGATPTGGPGFSGVGYDWHVVGGENDRPVVLIQPGPCGG